MTLTGQLNELLAPAAHSIRERERIVAPVSFVRRGSGVSSSAQETPAQRNGRRYEARVRQWLETHAAARGFKLWDHVWLEYGFVGDTHRRKAQPDFVLETKNGSGYVFEVKQTWTDTTRQLALYTSLLNHLGLDIIPATLCRNLTPLTPRNRIVRSFDDIEADSIMLVRK